MEQERFVLCEPTVVSFMQYISQLYQKLVPQDTDEKAAFTDVVWCFLETIIIIISKHMKCQI